MAASTPLITVITVVRNSAMLLEKTIQNITGQSFQSVEYIIIDGASTDGTLDIILQNKSKLSGWISEKDSGIYSAMNKGVALAKGKYICFINSGDVFTGRHAIEKAADRMNDAPDADIFYGNILVNNKKGGLTERIAPAPCNKHRMYFCHQSAFVRTELLRKYPFDEKYRMSADFKFFKQCYYRQCKFVHLNFPVAVFDTTGVSNTNRIAGIRENIAVIRETDRGWKKFLFMFRLYYTVGWLKIRGKK